MNNKIIYDEKTDEYSRHRLLQFFHGLLDKWLSQKSVNFERFFSGSLNVPCRYHDCNTSAFQEQSVNLNRCENIKLKPSQAFNRG